MGGRGGGGGGGGGGRGSWVCEGPEGEERSGNKREGEGELGV